MSAEGTCEGGGIFVRQHTERYHYLCVVPCNRIKNSHRCGMQAKVKGGTVTTIANPDFAQTVLASFNRQNAMQLIRASMPQIEHGMTEIHVPHWVGIEQQHGFVHGGVVGMIADSAAGDAAMTIVPANASVLRV